MTIDEIYQTTVDGLLDNARVNQVPLPEGWTPWTAIDAYNPDVDFEAFSNEQCNDLRDRVVRFMRSMETER
jgi:hypothetical protein